MSIRQSTPPNLIGQPDNKLFRKNDFDSLIWLKGYSVIIEQAIACPCRGKSGSALPTCQNCLGLGWVFVNPVETKALITSINVNTKFKEWSPELTGTVQITVRDEDRLSFFDKVTFKTRTSILSEVKPVQTYLEPIGNLTGTVVHTTANSATTKQKETITLTGTSGEAIITKVGALSKIVTFTTNLTTSASNFVTVNAAEYLTKNIVLTSSGANLIFESTTNNLPFTAPTIENNTLPKRFVFLPYKAKAIKSAFIFNSITTKLIPLPSTEYLIKPENNAVLQLADDLVLPTGFNNVISVEYEYEVSYNVVDNLHDFRSTFVSNEKGQNIEYNMPIQAVGRRSHLVSGQPTNYAGNNLLDNSTE